MVYNSLWSANEKRRGQMIHPKEALTATYDGREKKTTNTKGISLELLGIVFVFHTLLRRHWCRRRRWLQIRSAWWWEESSTLTVLSTEPLNSKLNDVKKEIGISMGIHCQWWFSPLWFDRISWLGGGQNRMMTYVLFPCHLAWDPSALVWWNVGAEKTLAGSHVRFPQHFGEQKQIILGNDLSAKQKRHKIKQFVSFSFSNNKCSPRHLIWVPTSKHSHNHFDLFALAQRARDDLHSHENEEKKTRNYYVFHYHFPCNNYKLLLHGDFFLCQRLNRRTVKMTNKIIKRIKRIFLSTDRRSSEIVEDRKNGK